MTTLDPVTVVNEAIFESLREDGEIALSVPGLEFEEYSRALVAVADEATGEGSHIRFRGYDKRGRMWTVRLYIEH